MQATANRRGSVRPRVLYWYRSPPDVKVGREPFDAEVRRALEKQYPDIAFDWRAIVETPIPSADADKWRERRRAERAAKQTAREEESAETADAEAESSAAAEADETAITAASVPEDQGQIPISADRGPDLRKSRSAPVHQSSSDPAKRRRRCRVVGQACAKEKASA